MSHIFDWTLSTFFIIFYSMKLCGRPISKSDLLVLRELIRKNFNLSRRQLSMLICREFRLIAPNGKLQDVGCRKSLLALERDGLIQLPPAQARPGSQTTTPKSIPERWIPKIPEIRCSLSELGGITIEPVTSPRTKRYWIWKYLMETYHYLGSGPLCGHQIRYLIHSERYGYLGGLAFSSAAFRLAARDQWIGWDDGTRSANLCKVVSNSRFLLVPQVRVKNLASHVLSLSLRRLVGDWEQRYRIRPLLVETFVELGRFQGTSYKACNWVYVGETKGRGRQDRHTRCALPVKAIFLYPLAKDSREQLLNGLKQPSSASVASGDWVEEEFSATTFGDKRNVQRVKQISRDFSARPGANIPQACGSRAKTKATYRFFSNERVKMNQILEGHFASTINRIKKEQVVLVVQDTTVLNYNTRPATQGLGLIGSKPDGLMGLLVHDALCFNLEGTPLGLVHVHCWARDPSQFGKKKLRGKLPIEMKESYKWLAAFRKTQQVQRLCPQTQVVVIGDREADIYELFHLALSDAKGAHLLIRAEHNRQLANQQPRLQEYMNSVAISGYQVIQVPRRGKQPAREARLAIRFSRVSLKPPTGKSAYGNLTVWAILAEETQAPEGVTPLRWLLLTTLPVETFEQAIEKLHWYKLRWGIEVYHRVLKDGCKIEQRQLGSADRIENCLAVDMIVAWRIFHLTKLGREIPNLPCTVFFEDAEWKALVAYHTQNPIPPSKPPTLTEAIRMTASLGGFLGRKCDGEPGTKTLWLGLQRLDDLTEMWKIAMGRLAPEYLRPPPSA